MGFLSSLGSIIKKVAPSAIGYVSANPWIGTLGSTALSLAGGERGNILRRQAATRQMAFEAASARQMMDFQREMANTAHQRQIKDLRKAGLNPILSARYGGAAAPPGAMARGSLPAMQDPYTPAAQVDVNARRLAADIPVIHQLARKTQAEVNLTRAQTNFTKQNTWNHVLQASKIVAETGLTNEQILLTMAQTGLVSKQALQSIQQAKTLAEQEALFFAQGNVQKEQERMVQNQVSILDTEVARKKVEYKWVTSFIGEMMLRFGYTATELAKMFQTKLSLSN